MPGTRSAFWFRRDLRFEDNHGFYRALAASEEVLPVFIFDPVILDRLDDPADRRIDFIHRRLVELDARLRGAGRGGLLVLHGDVSRTWSEIFARYGLDALHCNRDYEPYARERDAGIAGLAAGAGVAFHAHKDQVRFERDEVLKPDGNPYTVFTPYKKQWLAAHLREPARSYPSETLLGRCRGAALPPVPSLESMGFARTDLEAPPATVDVRRLRGYGRLRDFPAENATSRLGVHLRFGTVSVRDVVSRAEEIDQVWFGELIWREFFMMILHHFPHSAAAAFKRRYENIPWRDDMGDFAVWREGRTGYPLVDAGLRELVATGHMHNRVRMVAASFLVKHLLLDWRWGERWFASKLLDYDLAANAGNWQWAAGTGCDAAPYFRIFNPVTQAKRFDPDTAYIRRWVPEIGTPDYPEPMIDHAFARERALRTYRAALGGRDAT